MADPHESGAAAPKRIRPGWRTAILVCKACEKRRSGPRKVKAKDVGKAIARAARDSRLGKVRVVYTSCLGACPKKALTVAATPPGEPAAMVAFRRGDDPASTVAALFAAVASEGMPVRETAPPG